MYQPVSSSLGLRILILTPRFFLFLASFNGLECLLRACGSADRVGDEGFIGVMDRGLRGESHP